MAEDCDYILELVKENHLVTDDQIAPECKDTMERHGIRVITTTTQA